MSDPEASAIPQEIVDLWQDAVKNNRKARFTHTKNSKTVVKSHVGTHRRLKVLYLRSGFMLGKIGVCYLASPIVLFKHIIRFSPRLVIENTRSHTDRTVAQKKMGCFASVWCGAIITTQIKYCIQIYIWNLNSEYSTGIKYNYQLTSSM